MHSLLNRVSRLGLLTVFEAAATAGSFTAAARELGMTQSGVSRQITALERAIRRPLFDRRGNKVILNSAGRSLLVAVQQGFDTIERGLDEIVHAEPTFLVAANPGYAQQWLVPHLHLLQQELSEARLRLRLFDRDGELAADVFDVAIHLTVSGGLPPGSIRLFDEEAIPVASPDFASRHELDGSTTAARLLDVNLLHLDGRDRQWMGWQDWFASNGLVWSADRAVTAYNNYALVIDSAMAGRGVALGWCGLIDAALDSGLLVPVGPKLSRPSLGYYLIPGPKTDPLMVDRVACWLAGLANFD